MSSPTFGTRCHCGCAKPRPRCAAPDKVATAPPRGSPPVLPPAAKAARRSSPPLTPPHKGEGKRPGPAAPRGPLAALLLPWPRRCRHRPSAQGGTADALHPAPMLPAGQKVRRAARGRAPVPLSCESRLQLRRWTCRHGPQAHRSPTDARPPAPPAPRPVKGPPGSAGNRPNPAARRRTPAAEPRLQPPRCRHRPRAHGGIADG